MDMDFVAAGVPDGNRIEHERKMTSQHAKAALATPGRGTRPGNLCVSAAAKHDPEDTQPVRAQASLDAVLDVLGSAANTREHGLGTLSDAYEAVALLGHGQRPG